jgi:urea transport system substrate-binding protein
VLGKKLEPVVVDPASNWPLFAEKAAPADHAGQGRRRVRLLDLGVAQVGAAGVQGAERILFYPVQYEGEELERTCSTPAPRRTSRRSRRRLPDEQGRRRRQALGAAGTDYVYPRTTNKILSAFLQQGREGRSRHHDQLHAVRSLRLADHRRRHQEVRGRRQEDRVVSTINGDANVPFYKELGNQGIKAKDMPVVAFSVGEEELRGVDTKPLVGHLAAWNYFSR